MNTKHDAVPPVPSPQEGEPPRAERDPRSPTATAPDSVEESVYEEAEYAGQDGPDAADPPTAEGKHGGASSDSENSEANSPKTTPGADLDPDESADLLETQKEAHEIKQTRKDQQDEDLISLDTPD